MAIFYIMYSILTIVGIALIYWLIQGGTIKRNMFQRQKINEYAKNVNYVEFEHMYEKMMNSPNMERVKKEYKKNTLKKIALVILVIVGVVTMFVNLFLFIVIIVDKI